MNLLPVNSPKTFNLLSIGQRGVGKTVFLVGSYAELHSDSKPNHTQQLWFDCQDGKEQENIDRLLNYIARSGQYPPPTLKITNFNFSLKSTSHRGTETLSHFGWWDIPGESCDIDNPDFQTMVFKSSGCCVFIDAYALVHEPDYRPALDDIIQKVMPIATLVHLNNFRYAFALILTKCDLIEPDSLSQKQLEEGLQPLTSRLDGVKANYQKFYSKIPIASKEGVSTLKVTGAAAPLLWIVCELSKARKPGSMNNLLKLVTRLRSKSTLRQEEVNGSLQSLFSSDGKTSRLKKILGLYLFPTTRKYILFLALAIVGSVGMIGFFSLDYLSVLQRQPKNLDALSDVATLRQRGEFQQAIPLMEKIVQQEPQRLDLHFQLAHLYEITGQVLKAETVYDQILAQQNNNIQALVGKAVLRKARGDIKTAKTLLAQAEKAAPAEFKAQIRAVAQKTLASTVESIPPTN